MIQRVQSLLYLAVSILAILILFTNPSLVKFTDATGKGKEVGMVADLAGGVVLHKSLNYLLVGFMALCALGTIFLYKNLTLQMKASLFGAAVCVVFISLLWIDFTLAKKQFPASDAGLGFQIVWPVLSCILFLAAYFLVRKDNNLLQSMNRLR